MGTWHGCPLLSMHDLGIGLGPALWERKILWTYGGSLHILAPRSLAGMAIHVPICPRRALGLLAWSPTGFWPGTHLGIRLVHLASSLVQFILGG